MIWTASCAAAFRACRPVPEPRYQETAAHNQPRGQSRPLTNPQATAHPPHPSHRPPNPRQRTLVLLCKRTNARGAPPTAMTPVSTSALDGFITGVSSPSKKPPPVQQPRAEAERDPDARLGQQRSPLQGWIMASGQSAMESSAQAMAQRRALAQGPSVLL